MDELSAIFESEPATRVFYIISIAYMAIYAAGFLLIRPWIDTPAARRWLHAHAVGDLHRRGARANAELSSPLAQTQAWQNKRARAQAALQPFK